MNLQSKFGYCITNLTLNIALNNIVAAFQGMHVSPAKHNYAWLCYVAVCNNYAICNKLQTALNCSAVCNTSYFKLRCDGNAICNVLQIASKFYHLKILKRRKKLINGKMHRFNHILLWIQSDTNLFELGMQKCQSTLQLFRTLFCPRTFAKWGGGH